MAAIHTLVDDIHAMVGKAGELTLSGFSDRVANAYTKQVSVREEKVRKPNTLYFSEIGDPCPRRLWYKYNAPAVSETLPSTTRIKFLYGDMLEELVLQLARDAGHDVQDEQKEVEYAVPDSDWRIRGRIDAVVDGCVVDVKSVTKYSEKKFHDGLHDDPFGYYDQLNGYTCVLKNDNMGFLTIQKELGHIHYFPFSPDKGLFAKKVAIAVNSVQTQSEERIAPVAASATSKNMKLDTACSYCSFKQECWKDCNDGVGLRAFAYANKVEFLTKVVDVPRVMEIDLTAEIDCE